MRIYPNPVNGVSRLSNGEKGPDNRTISVYPQYGRPVMEIHCGDKGNAAKFSGTLTAAHVQHTYSSHDDGGISPYTVKLMGTSQREETTGKFNAAILALAGGGHIDRNWAEGLTTAVPEMVAAATQDTPSRSR